MEFDRYKANRVVEIRANYAGKLNGLIARYNRLFAKVNSTRFIINKQAEFARLKLAYEAEFKIFNAQINAEIAKITMPAPIYVANAIHKALLIGINYIGTENELNGCINDMENLAGRLVEFKSVAKMTDNTVILPTKTNILREFTKLLRDAVSGDCLLFAFSGHGSQMNDRNGDEMVGRDECLFTLDYKMIIDDELNLIIRQNMKPGVTLFALLDCCHSGTVMDLKYNYLHYLENPKNAETAGNVIMISGCRDEQTSADAYEDGKYQGAMTWAFLGNLQPNITWRQLVMNMCSSLTKSGYTQVPKISSGKFINLDSKFLFA